MIWHWLIVIYLFLGGLGAGAYLTSFAAEKGWFGTTSSLKRTGYFIAAPIVGIGTLLLVFDLGQGLYKPWLLLRLLTNFSSIMTWGVYILSLFIIVGLIKAYSVLKNKTVPPILTWTGAVLALATGAYTGLLLATVQAIPFWNTGTMPILFVVSALSTGLSITALLAPVIEKGENREGRERQAHLLLIAIELVIITIFTGIMLTGVKGPAGAESVARIFLGTYAVVFWGYFICLGLMFPLVVFTLQHLRTKQTIQKVVTEPSIAINKHTALQKEKPSHLNIIADISVLMGGLALRALIIFNALPIWDGVTIL